MGPNTTDENENFPPMNADALDEAAQAVYQLSEWDHGFGHVPSMDLASAAVGAYLKAMAGHV